MFTARAVEENNHYGCWVYVAKAATVILRCFAWYTIFRCDINPLETNFGVNAAQMLKNCDLDLQIVNRLRTNGHITTFRQINTNQFSVTCHYLSEIFVKTTWRKSDKKLSQCQDHALSSVRMLDTQRPWLPVVDCSATWLLDRTANSKAALGLVKQPWAKRQMRDPSSNLTLGGYGGWS